MNKEKITQLLNSASIKALEQGINLKKITILLDKDFNVMKIFNKKTKVLLWTGCCNNIESVDSLFGTIKECTL